MHIFRSNPGTNFIGAIDGLRIEAVNVEDGELRNNRTISTSQEPFGSSTPPASNGWDMERTIGSARRILNSMFMKVADKHLTHDVLSTIMREATTILNNRPLVPVSVNSGSPYILCPATLLTRKTANAFPFRNLGEFQAGLNKEECRAYPKIYGDGGNYRNLHQFTFIY